MKKLLVITTLLWISILFVGCGKKDSNTETTPDTTIAQESTNTTETAVTNETCTNNSWVFTDYEDWPEKICVFDDETFCFIDVLENWECVKGMYPLKEDEVDNTEDNSSYSECDKLGKNIVCWKDWQTYLNKCYLDVSWVEEETELAHVENDECIFG